MKNLTKALIVFTLVAIMGTGATAFAGKGKFMGTLSEEEITKLNEERNAFFTATQDLRRNIYQKHLELKSELAKKNPDSKKAAALQKELSGFKGQFDQKRTGHRIKMSKINPNFGLMGQGFCGKKMGRGQEIGRGQHNQSRQW